MNYNSKVDVWSIGVLTHILLSGCPPFHGKTKPEIHNSILTGSPHFGRVRNFLSEEAKNFVLSCLTRAAEERPTIAELLQHPFITLNATAVAVDSEAALQIAQDLTSFYKQTVFQSGIISFIIGIHIQ